MSSRDKEKGIDVESAGNGPIPRKRKCWESKKGKEKEQGKEGSKVWDFGV